MLTRCGAQAALGGARWAGLGALGGGQVGVRTTQGCGLQSAPMTSTTLLRPATTLDDVCALVGWSRTVLLVQWYGGTNLYVPDKPTENHPLVKLLGERPMARLIEEFGGQTVWLPVLMGGMHSYSDALRRKVRDAAAAGMGKKAISGRLMISERHASRILRELVDAGLLPEQLLGKTGGENVPENALGKAPAKTPLKNVPENALGSPPEKRPGKAPRDNPMLRIVNVHIAPDS